MAEIRRRGTLAAVVCTDPFKKLGQTQARVFGVPDLPLLMIAHPLGGIGLEDVKARAEHLLPQLAALLKEHAQ